MSRIDTSKFTVGQTVECIGISVGEETNDNYRYAGMGWKKGKIFKIATVTHTSVRPFRYIYWAGGHSAGVYEEHLKLIEEDWDT